MSKNLRKFLQKYDGLSTLNYETIYDDFTSNDAVGIAGFEIRPFKPMKQEVFINNENIYKQRFNTTKTPSDCEFITFDHVDLKDSYQDLPPETDVETKNKYIQCNSGNYEGMECNGFTRDKSDFLIPFPLHTILNHTNQYTTIRHCKNDLGLFQVFPDVSLSRTKGSSQNSH